jgi:hypothetical protein
VATLINDPGPFNLSSPEELTKSNIEKINDNSLGVFIVSKFAELTHIGALAIESGKIRSGLLELSRTFESSFVFRYRITPTEQEANQLRDAIRAVIAIRKLGE